MPARPCGPSCRSTLVIDHSVVAEVYGTPDAFQRNADLELERNVERYRFLRWGQQAFSDFRVVPPDTGICHQVNLEGTSRRSSSRPPPAARTRAPSSAPTRTRRWSTASASSSWGAGGIEAEAAMLGQPVSMLIRVVGFKLSGKLPEGATATDLVLTVTEMLRKHGVVGKFVECYGPGLASIPVENRATIGNMSPEYGSTVTIFPVDAGDDPLPDVHRPLAGAGVALVEAYAKEQQGSGWIRPPNRVSRSASSSTCRQSVRASPARRVRRTAFLSTGPRSCSPPPSRRPSVGRTRAGTGRLASIRSSR